MWGTWWVWDARLTSELILFFLYLGYMALESAFDGPTRGTAFAAFLSALSFSLMHYVGAYGDRFALGSFVFRFLAGLVFTGVYLLRGFGIVAWSHALYDLGILLRRP